MISDIENVASDTEIHDYIVTEILKDDRIELSVDRPLIRDGLLNSIGIMKLITFLSDRFAIDFEDDDYDIGNFETLGAIQKLLHRRSDALQCRSREAS